MVARHQGIMYNSTNILPCTSQMDGSAHYCTKLPFLLFVTNNENIPFNFLNFLILAMFAYCYIKSITDGQWPGTIYIEKWDGVLHH
jgi:hypothetical protein